MNSTATRPYEMKARQVSVDATRESICRATIELWLKVSYDEMTLDEVARRAGVTRQTVLRHYGNKENLLLAAADWYAPQIEASSRVTPGDIDAAVAAMVAQYETMGDANVRMLEVEDRIAAVRQGLARGRAQHRDWVTETFAPWLEQAGDRDRQIMVDALYAATDVMVWKLLRRDFGRSREDTEVVIRTLVAGLVGSAPRRGGGK